MAAAYAYTPDIWPPLALALCLAALGGYSWWRRRVPGARPFAIACFFDSLWLLGIAAQSAATDLPTLVAARTFEALWRVPTATAGFCFTLEYVQPGRWLTRRNLILLAIPPVIAVAAILTNDVLHLAWGRFVVDGLVQPEPALIGWLLVVYVLMLALLQVIALSWLFIRLPQERWPAGLMLSALILTRGLVMRDLVQSGPTASGDNTLLALLLPVLIYAIALFGFHIFDPLTAARETALQQIRAGVIVFDTDWHVVSLNPAAETILGIRSGAARGKMWHALVPPRQFTAVPDAAVHPAAETTYLPEMTVGDGAGARVYAPALSTLKDRRGPLIGYLLMLRDVTEERRAQAQILEQQRTLAVLEERERLARELHDGLGQSLAAAHLQASAARLLLDQGETERVDEQLANLAETTLEAQADMREYLLGAQSIVSADHGFFPLVEQYLRRFTRQHGLPVELIIPPEVAEQDLSPTVEVQLMRIIQEALSNARKHARGHCVQVIFALAGAQARVDIVDDGQGFDPAAGPREGYGLQSMRARAEGVGGSLSIIANSGRGTRVTVLVPLKESRDVT